jgi:type II secretory ATPase GspE/PulE/Tfp pilus assembly ATPase PilB-like protein
LLNPIPEIEIQTNYLADPVEVLTALPPKELLQELLGRVLYAGIGRLYFERQPHYGRVLWSQNGVLQSVLERLEPEIFQGVLNELKKLTHLPTNPTQKTKQVEVERLYQQNRLLLRFKLMPTEHGEEATLQVLRGAALKFHQQQQLANLERDALTIAKQLQTKVNEIRDRARLESGLGGAKLDALPALNQLLRSIEQQLGTLADEEVTEE